MILEISSDTLQQIHNHGEQAYPQEGAGLMLGVVEDACKHVQAVVSLQNVREESARHNRYLLSPEDYLRGEDEAARLGLEVLGVFHSHPDHPNQPSEYDREWAWPTFSYLITSVRSGRAVESRAWCLDDDRGGFIEEEIRLIR